MIAESMPLDDARARRALADRATAGEPAGVPQPAGDDLWSKAEALVEAGITSPVEASRVMGWKRPDV